ncbi:ABC transporter ATP-binding protein [Breoghania sp. L-A4]|uniref:ABC transporter ATP-binding protein n=1 Tax=Breoghania sp. L-A4 TaxID=2304600 RepID=UPI000E358FAA|nr:ABC transporter ATP-binding protein [Breoghania sp. L-A4]AXS40532.1 ABC transporter ATP-binding protein [Breoghania sp. L-A4]
MNVNAKADPTHWGRRGTAAATIAARLSFSGICHDYDGQPSVRDISIDVDPGEVLCLLGHSGCGKTTLLRIAAGVERQTSGLVMINGREVAGPNTFLAPERRGVGLMFQDYALFPHLTILQNVCFGLTGLPRAEAEREGLSALARVGLEAYAADYPHSLSGGEQQRVALARAIAPRPAVVLMDEPFSGLDRRLRDNVRDETLAVLRETRATCIVVTHDPEEAMRMGDRIALMRAGRLVQIGPADTLYDNPVDVFAARFFSELNEVSGVARGGRAETPVGIFDCEGVADGVDVDICLRPQGIEVMADSGAQADDAALQGRVTRTRFLGEVDLLDIAVSGLDLPLKARVRERGRFRVGDDVTLAFDPTDILVFPRADGLKPVAAGDGTA